MRTANVICTNMDLAISAVHKSGVELDTEEWKQVFMKVHELLGALYGKKAVLDAETLRVQIEQNRAKQGVERALIR